MNIYWHTLKVLISALILLGCSKKAGIEGTIVDGSGKPMSGVKLIAEQVSPTKGYEHFETTSNADGSFKFIGLFPASEYVIKPWSDAWKPDTEIKVDGMVAVQGTSKDAEIKMHSGTEGQASILDKPLVVRFILLKSGVLVDSKTGLQWTPSNGKSMTHNQAEAYVKSLNLDGGGWKLPTISELSQNYNPEPRPFLFNIISSNYVWSSELCKNGSLQGARLFGFYRGTGGNDYCVARDYSSDSGEGGAVLAVRSPK